MAGVETAASRVVSEWPRYPSLYEISTWVWLTDLSRRYGRPVDLACVPGEVWDEIAGYGFDAVWLMGVWERSPAGIAIANRNEGLLADFRRALPDFRAEDNVGSPYCVRRYVVDLHFGGPRGLAVARAELAKRGMNLVLDFVPNHVAPDHPWVSEHPDYFIRGSGDDLRANPAAFVCVGGTVCACGKDPYFPAWPDVLQLNAFDGGLRQAVIETLWDVATQCDGVRCDMAMLFLNDVFARTWGNRAGQRPATEYWDDVIAAVKAEHPGFLFIAEAYWDLEWELQQKGFDFCYDKKLYDRLEHHSAEDVRMHLCADMGYQNKLLRFLENHDEPRAAATFAAPKLTAATLMIATLPGARMFYEGQFEGRKVRTPVFLGRRPEEPANRDSREFCRRLMQATESRVFREGEWKLCERAGWPDNASYLNIVAWCWAMGDERYLVVINLSDWQSQAQVQIPWADLAGKQWRLGAVLTATQFERDGSQMQSPGLYVDLKPWEFHFLQVGVSR